MIGIVTTVGRVQALNSALVTSFSPVIAGQLNVFKIQAKDIFSNVVVETNELFEFIIMNTATK